MNNIKVAWRHLARNKLFSIVNILGMAIGLACCMLIMLYVGHEKNFDSFHKNGDRIVFVQAKLMTGNDSTVLPYLSFGTGPMARAEDPDVEGYLRISSPRPDPVVQNALDGRLKFTESRFLFADSNFFNFFSFPLVSGSPQTLLADPFSVVVSEQTARKYFGSADPVGKTLTFNQKYTFTITGIAKEAPSNSSIQFDFVASLSAMSRLYPEVIAAESQVVRSSFLFKTFFLLRQRDAGGRLIDILHRLHVTGNGEGATNERYFTTPLADIHLEDSRSGAAGFRYTRFFFAIALLVLFLAMSNYISLSTARSTLRAREIGVRKAIGADRRRIALQFFVESALGTLISFVIAYLLCTFFQPLFFNYLDWHIDNSFLRSRSMLGWFLGLFLLTVLLSATYPAIVLSAFKPAEVLYGKFSRQARGRILRNGLTIFQFIVSTALLVVTLLIVRQIDFFRSTDTGVDRQNIIMVPFGTSLGQHFGAFRKEVRKLPQVQSLAVARYQMYKGYDTYYPRDEKTGKDLAVPVMTVDEDFPSFLHLKWHIQPADPYYYTRSDAVLLNRSAVSLFDFGRSPINESINLGRYSYRVAGVLDDFNFESLHDKIGPLCLRVAPSGGDSASAWAAEGGCLLVKWRPGADTRLLVERLAGIYGSYDAQEPFSYHFMDDAFNAMFTSESRLAKIAGLFSFFTIFISCLGLFGLAVFMIRQRNREISIRKLLGAATGNIAWSLSVSFLKWVAWGIGFGAGIAWLCMNSWLRSFAYRIRMDTWIFVIAAGGTLVVAFITVGILSIRAANQSPVNGLRSES
jgi:putative ABC transport system permease protein